MALVTWFAFRWVLLCSHWFLCPGSREQRPRTSVLCHMSHVMTQWGNPRQAFNTNFSVYGTVSQLNQEWPWGGIFIVSEYGLSVPLALLRTEGNYRYVVSGIMEAETETQRLMEMFLKSLIQKSSVDLMVRSYCYRHTTLWFRTQRNQIDSNQDASSWWMSLEGPTGLPWEKSHWEF